ncbi:MAG: pyridoxal phosphate-dependent aminotransferase, partial [Polyangiales bacterium]
MTTLRLSRSADAIRPGVFAELQTRIERFTAAGGDLVPLHIGDTFLDPPEEARFPAVIHAGRLEPELYRYGAPIGLAPLRAAFARRLGVRFGLTVDPDRELLLGAGATHALFCAARAVLDPGDDVLLASPYWPLAHGILAACGARVIEVPFTRRLYDDPSLDAGELFREALTPKTKAIYLITPNNPDGKVLTRAQLEQIAAVAIARGLWVFADEAYADHAFDAPHVSLATLPEMAERTITAHSLSKSHALAGVRLGCVVGAPALIKTARKIAIHTTFNVPVVAQRSALAALQAGDAW